MPRGTDAVIRVNGRSMEPAFADGSYVYVTHETPAIDAQEILYDEAYKEAGAAAKGDTPEE